MKKIKSLLFLGLFMMTSCLDILDKEPLDIISDNAVWSDPVLIDSYLAECYYQTSVRGEKRCVSKFSRSENI